MKDAKKTQITEQICKQAQLMRKGGANQTEIGKLLGINPCTVSRMEKAGFDFLTYQANQKLRREKERMPKAVMNVKAQDVIAAVNAEDQVPGQMEMDLTPEKPEMSDQTKLMRFQAHQADRIVKALEERTVELTMKLDRLNDTLSMILRAVRKE